jgi:hypothetical protein
MSSTMNDQKLFWNLISEADKNKKDKQERESSSN